MNEYFDPENEQNPAEDCPARYQLIIKAKSIALMMAALIVHQQTCEHPECLECREHSEEWQPYVKPEPMQAILLDPPAPAEPDYYREEVA